MHVFIIWDKDERWLSLGIKPSLWYGLKQLVSVFNILLHWLSHMTVTQYVPSWFTDLYIYSAQVPGVKLTPFFSFICLNFLKAESRDFFLSFFTVFTVWGQLLWACAWWHLEVLMFTMRMGSTAGILQRETSLSGRQEVQPSHSQVNEVIDYKVLYISTCSLEHMLVKL